MTEKNVNYSQAVTDQIVKVYCEADTDELRAAALDALSAETGKTVKSLRAKLVREGVYVKKTYTTKSGGKAETKDQIVTAIAEMLNVTEAQLGGLEKATKPALTVIRLWAISARETIEGLEMENDAGAEAEAEAEA